MKRLRPDAVVTVDGRTLPACTGQSLYAVLVDAGIWRHRTHPVSGAPEAGMCGMGTCLACLVDVDGRPDVRACAVEVHDGLRVRTGATW